MSTTVTGSGAVKQTKRVYLISGTVYKGYGVCYNWDAVGDIDGNSARLFFWGVVNLVKSSCFRQTLFGKHGCNCRG